MELVVTIGILAFIILAILFANAQMQKAAQAAHERAVALQDANEVLEQMRNAADTGIFPGNVTGTYPNNTATPDRSNPTALVGFRNLSADCGGLANPPQPCTWPFAFTPDPLSQEQVVVTYANPNADPLDVTVTVVWQENRVRRVNTSLRTLLTQRT